MKKIYTQSLFLFVFAICFSTSFAQNEDFESAPTGTISTVTAISGWSIYTAAHSFSTNSCALPQANGTPSVSAVFSTATGYIDAGVGTGYPIFSVFGAIPGSAAAASANPQLGFAPSGNSFLRINSSDISVSRIEMARKVVTVSAANALFDVAYISVLNTSSHPCCDAPAFTVKINNGNCSMLATVCTTANAVTFYSALNYLPVSNTNPATLVFNKWKVNTIDLSGYIAQTVTVDIIASHCTAGGHASYAFIDTRFRPSSVIVNGATTTLTANSINTLTSCQPVMTLTAPPNYVNYQWTGPGGFNSTLSTITASLQGNYVLTANNGNACSAVTNTFYFSFPSTTLQPITSNTAICPGNSATLSVSGVSSQTWVPGAQFTSSFVASPSATTTYSVIGINASGCAAIGTVVVTVINQPNLVPVSLTASICAGSLASISVVSGGTATWSPGAQTGTSIVVSPTTTTVYTVSANGIGGCLAQGTIAINIFTSSTIPLTLTCATPSICLGATAAIAVNAVGTATWMPGGITGNTLVVSPSVSTIYSVDVSTSEGCVLSSTYTLDVYPVACVSITTSNAVIQVGNSATLTVFGLSTYTWQTGSNAQSIVVSPPVTTDYSVHGHTAAGAYGVARITQFVDATVGLKQGSTFKDFKMYPNPASTQLIIQTNSAGSKFMLFDLSGRLVLEKQLLNAEQISIDLSGLERGLYQIRLENSKGEFYHEKMILEE